MNELRELSMYFTKASLHPDGTMHWAATVSDTGIDIQQQRVSKAFFENAISQVDERGLPSLVVSHYDFAGDGVPEELWKAGYTEAIFIDGDKFKAKGQLYPTLLGRNTFFSIQTDMRDNVPHDRRVRVSMGFYDQGHTIEKSDNGDILTYQKGWVRHLAVTRVPIRTSTEIGVWEEKSMVTKHSDAKSIVGEELADVLEKTRKHVGKSETEELIIKADGEDDMMAACVKEKMKDMSEEEATKVCEAEFKVKAGGTAWTPPPKGWTAASLEKYWAAMGGTVTSCMAKAEGHVSDTAKFCASLKDRVTGTTKWRGKEKKKADLSEEENLAEFEEWLYEELSEADTEERVEKMIKEGDSEIVLYTKDGSKVLGRFPYGKGKKYTDKDAAMAAAKKREGQIQFFKHQKSEGEDELEQKSEGEEVEKAGRRLQKQRVDEIASWIDDMKTLVTRGEDFLAWASQTQLTDSISEPQSRENPVEAVLASQAKDGDETEVMSEIDSDLSVFAKAVQEALESDMEPEEKSQYIQESLNTVGEAIAEVMTIKTEPVESRHQPDTEQLEAFNERVKAALSSPGLDRRAKFAALQDALGEVGTFLQRAVVDTTPPSQGDLQALITEAVRQGTQPLVQENATLKARLTDLEAALQTTQNVLQYPVQKSLTATPAMRQPVKKSAGGKLSAAEVARMTTTEAEVGLLY